MLLFNNFHFVFLSIFFFFFSFIFISWRLTFQSPLDCKEIQSVHPEGDKSWVFIGRTDAEAETPMRRVGSLEKTLMLGGIGGRRRRG